MGLFKFKSQYEIDLERIKKYASFFTQEKIKILDDTENWHDTVVFDKLKVGQKITIL